jgi:hypothetical protein
LFFCRRDLSLLCHGVAPLDHTDFSCHGCTCNCVPLSAFDTARPICDDSAAA